MNRLASCASRWPALGLVLALAGCAALAPEMLPPGSTIDQARHGIVSPTAEYALPGGGTRLEFARGSFGRETYMLDFDAKGVLVATQQALTEAHFATIAPGLPAAELRRQFGPPARVFGAGWQDHVHVWNYRFPGGDCVWFQVSVSDATQQVTSAGIGQDPACDGPNRERSDAR